MSLLERSAERLDLEWSKLQLVMEAYKEEGREYHNLEHIYFMLMRFEKYVLPNVDARAQRMIELGIWFHDVVYNPKARDNEERSVDYALDMLDLSKPDADYLRFLIMATKTHDAAGDENAQYLVDLDLSILGAADTRYLVYAENIRKEYAHVSDADYASSRSAFLRGMIEREELCPLLSLRMNGSAEALRYQARVNMENEIKRLTLG